MAIATLIVIALSALPAGASPTTLYVDRSNPACTDSGPGSQAQPYCTIVAGASKAVAGQTVLVASGTYGGGVTVGHSGTSSAPITLTAAPGASVTISGGSFGIKASSRTWIVIDGFTVTGSSGYGIQVTSSSSNVEVNNVTVSATNSSGIQVSGSSAVTVSGATVTGAGDQGIYMTNSSSNVTVDGASVSHTGNNGIYASNSNAVTIKNSHTSYAGQPVSGSTKKGIYLGNTSNSFVLANTSDHNTDAGIFLSNGSTNDLVSGNVTFSNARQYTRAAPGIDVRSPGNTVAGNISYSNEDSGIQFYNGGGSSVVVDNVCFNNGDHGIDDLNSTYQVIVSNTVYGNTTAGINVEGTKGTSASSGATLENNISVDNGLHSFGTRGNVRIDANSTSGTRIDHDLVNLSSSGTMFTWGNTQYTSLAALQSATGQESHGQQADPRWVAPGSGDLHLRAGSPAIDSADSGAPHQPSTDFAGAPRVDDPATPNTGIGPRTYDDRGAYEYQPGSQTDNPPNASLTVTPSSGQRPLPVTADASASTDTDATPIANYRFDFGDGTVVGPQAGATAHHTYTQAGSYTVTVTVTDTGGLSSTATASVDVSNSPPPDNPPNAALTVTPSSGNAPLPVTADASASTDTDATPIANYRFDFGDGTVVGPQAGATAHHTYTQAGSYTVTVTVTDTGGLSSTATASVDVSNSPPPDNPPNASLTVTPSSGNAPLPVTADASASTDTDATPIANYRFDFGDGTVVGPQAGATAQHTYTQAGSYTVTVTVTDTGGLFSSATSQVTVANPVGTNLVGNPGFETNTTGWAGSGSGVTLTRVSGGHSGSWAATLANTGSGNVECNLNDSPNWIKTTTAGTYRGSIWVQAPTAGTTVKIRFREYLNGTFVGQSVAQFTLTTAWQQIAVNYTVQSVGSNLDFNVYVSGAPPGNCFTADDASITQS